MTNKFLIACDGSCNNAKPEHGGWGFVASPESNSTFDESMLIKRSGYVLGPTTNNLCEMEALLQSLLFIKEHFADKQCEFEVLSDSEYVVRGYNERMQNWLRNGWRNSTGPVKNLDKWKALIDLKNELNHFVKVVWVRGHNGNMLNEISDKLANEGRLSYKSVVEDIAWAYGIDKHTTKAGKIVHANPWEMDPTDDCWLVVLDNGTSYIVDPKGFPLDKNLPENLYKVT